MMETRKKLLSASLLLHASYGRQQTSLSIQLRGKHVNDGIHAFDVGFSGAKNESFAIYQASFLFIYLFINHAMHINIEHNASNVRIHGGLQEWSFTTANNNPLNLHTT
jgi:hypothetical protein